MQASVWPERISTPPSLAMSGKTWPGRTNGAAAIVVGKGAHSVGALLRRNSVVSPWRQSTETVKAVPSGASFAATMGEVQAPGVLGRERAYDPRRMANDKGHLSGVQSDAATNRSPSFAVVIIVTTRSPAAKAASTASTRW